MMTLLEQLQASLDNVAARKARGELTHLSAAVSQAAVVKESLTTPQPRVPHLPEECYYSGPPLTEDFIYAPDGEMPGHWNKEKLAAESRHNQYVVWDLLGGYARRFSKTAKARVRARREGKRAAREQGIARGAAA